MRKYLKYNHLLAKIVIFANVALLTQAMNELVSEGHRIDPEAVAVLSPYITQHLIRFGLYHMDCTRPLRGGIDASGRKLRVLHLAQLIAEQLEK